MKFLASLLAFALCVSLAHAQTVTPQIGGGIGQGFDGGISGAGGIKPFKITAEGDSITLGLGGVPAYPFVGLASMPGATASTPGTNTPTSSPVTGIPGIVNLIDIGTSGISLTTINANYATRVGAQYDPTKTNMLTVMGGTNGTETVNQLYILLRSIVRKARVQGFQRVVVGTTIARDDAGETTKWATILAPFNVLINAYWNSDLDADGIMDFGASPLFSPASAALNLTYYTSDALHPNVLGEASMGAIATGPMLTALQGPTVQVLPPATWSVVDYDSSHLTLSNSNRTVAWTSTGFTNPSVRGFIGKSSGKWYWEVSADSASFVEIGIGNQTFDYTATTFNLQNNPNTLAWGYSSNNLVYNSTTLATMGAISNGDIIQCAMDLDAKLYWTRKSTGNWNNNPSANPATGVGGVDISPMVAASTPQTVIYPAGYIRQNGGQFTSNFTLSQMTGPVPSGFTALSPLNWLLERDLNPASNDNNPVGLARVG